jgi:undecaprenyl-diphosphatase
MDFLQEADHGLMDQIGTLHFPWLDTVMGWATRVGDSWTLDAVAVLAVLGFLALRQWRASILMALTALLAFGINEAVKHYVQRERPDMAWRSPSVKLPGSPSFPSGHALNSMTIYGTAAMLAARRLSRRSVREAVLALGVALPLLIGVSRSYLGVHWPTDVFAGWCAGLACALLACWVDELWGRRAAPPTSPSAQLGEKAVVSMTPAAPDALEPGGPIQPPPGP